MTQPLSDPARDERELTQLVKDNNEAVVKADVAVLERALHEDYVHHRPRGTVEDRSQYLENRKARRVDFESLCPPRIGGEPGVRGPAWGGESHRPISSDSVNSPVNAGNENYTICWNIIWSMIRDRTILA